MNFNLEKTVEPFIHSNLVTPIKIEEQKLKLTSNRFDLAIKLFFLEEYTKFPTIENKYSEIAYKEHIHAFTLGKFTEKGADNKSTIDDYKNEFIRTYQSIEEFGFDSNKSLIPIAVDGSIVNGAHRASSSIFLNKSVSTIQTNIQPYNYGYKFFKSRGVPTEVLDIGARKFIQYDNSSYIAIVWPAANGQKNDIERILGDIVYKKELKLSKNGVHNLLSIAYKNEKWLGSRESNFSGINSKLLACMPKLGTIKVYLFQKDSLTSVLSAKEDIRKLFNIGKHSIHITDTKQEAIDLADVLFSKSGTHFLDNSHPNTFLDFHTSIIDFKLKVDNLNLDVNNYVLVSGMVMAAYGLRSANDIDYLKVENSALIPDSKFDYHDKELEYHSYKENDLVLNPNFHFKYEGVKIISFDCIKKFKKNRNEKKDRLDLKLMSSIDTEENKWVKVQYFYYYQSTKIRQSVISIVKKLLKSVGLFDIIKKIYRRN